MKKLYVVEDRRNPCIVDTLYIQRYNKGLSL